MMALRCLVLAFVIAGAGCKAGSSDADVAKAQAEAEKAKAEAEKAKAEAEKAKAEAERAKSQLAEPNRVPGAPGGPGTSPAAPATGAPSRSLTITVDVDSTKANGKAWDAAGGAPDIALCATSAGVTTCAPDGASIGSVVRPQCRDAFRCTFTMQAGSDTVNLDVVDVDIAVNDPIGSGSCRRGATCRLGQATVSIQ